MIHLLKIAFRKFVFLFMPILLVLFLYACPYSSDLPIDQPCVPVDQGLLKTWVKVARHPEKMPAFCVVTQLEECKYQIVENVFNRSDSTYLTTRYVGHISMIDSVRFLNLQKDGQGRYFLLRLDIDSVGNLVLFEVTDNMDEVFGSSDELRNFIERHMNLSFFYNRNETRYRVIGKIPF